MGMIEFAQGFIGNPTTEFYEFLACALLFCALAAGWIWWYRLDTE